MVTKLQIAQSIEVACTSPESTAAAGQDQAREADCIQVIVLSPIAQALRAKSHEQ